MGRYDQRIIEQLEQKGYKCLDKERNNIYGRMENDVIYVVLLGHFSDLSADAVIKYNDNIKKNLSEGGRIQVRVLNLFILQDGLFDDAIMDVVNRAPNVWLFTDDYGKLYIFENQPEDFDGLHDVLEKDVAIKKTGIREWARRNLGVATTIIVAINVIVYVISVINPYLEVNLSDNYFYVVEMGQYYRVITSMFVHFGISHLVNNMIVLLIMGPRAERLMGKIVFVISYLLTGIAASICSLYYSDYYTFSAGASGAICGVFGMLIVYAITHKGNANDLSLRYLVFVSAATILNGFTTTGIDNYAHIGGFISGIVIGTISILIHNMVVKRSSM